MRLSILQIKRLTLLLFRMHKEFRFLQPLLMTTGKEEVLNAAVLTSEPSWNGNLLHIRFETMTPEVADALSAFIAERAAPVRTAVRAPGHDGRVIPFARR